MLTKDPPMRQGYRYICCSRCGVRQQISKETDTRHGYYCPECDRKKDKQYAIKNKIDYSVYTFYGVWHGIKRRAGKQ